MILEKVLFYQHGGTTGQVLAKASNTDGDVEWINQTGGSTNDFTNAYKTKLDGIATGANKTTVENVLTSTSTTNALSANQGRVLNVAISGLKKKILWSNTNTSTLTTFNAQTITLNSTDYDYVIVFAFRNYAGSTTRTVSCIIEKNKAGELIYSDFFGNEGARAWTRQITITSNNKVSVGGATINGNESNNVLAPYKIVGCKY